MNVTGRIFDAPPMCWATSVAEKVEAVAAATMPRGAIQPVNARSPAVMSVRSVARKATSGLVISTRIAISASVGRIRCRSEAGVTVAEMEMNSTPIISCTRVSKNGRRAGASKPRRLAMASPMTMAEMSPASSRITSQQAATATTEASWADVPRISPSRSLRSSSHSSATPTSPPARPTPMPIRNCSN